MHHFLADNLRIFYKSCHQFVLLHCLFVLYLTNILAHILCLVICGPENLGPDWQNYKIHDLYQCFLVTAAYKDIEAYNPIYFTKSYRLVTFYINMLMPKLFKHVNCPVNFFFSLWQAYVYEKFVYVPEWSRQKHDKNV